MMDTDTQNTQPDAVDLIVAQWRREMPALAAENMALIGRLKRCAALVQPQLDSVFAEFGLSGGGFDVLATLRRAGSPYTLTPTELFASLMVTSGTMTTRLKNLEAQGWIRRLPNPEDARSMLVQLTDSGKALIEEVVFKHVQNEQKLLEAVPKDVQKQLNEGLAVLMQVWEKRKDNQ
ncbi:MarR family winged helix-turn-helix transcriptional regulator [Neisseria wadsworthii]|uniref:MarR family winged helix-turn-helix transcriptional regulator n=1 Tax=Neisseria wadsworthii TaxID=607711 RepID=UPI000D2FED02|nr:MarR family transcriptional regulator [Neisseria wadsworthii]